VTRWRPALAGTMLQPIARRHFSAPVNLVHKIFTALSTDSVTRTTTVRHPHA
jgi:hypothetical protein